MANKENLYTSETLEGNWFEDRFFDADSRRDEVKKIMRPRNDDVENLPRIARVVRPTGKVFQMTNDETPEEHYKTVSMETYIDHHYQPDSVTRRRLNTTSEDLQKMLSVGSVDEMHLPDYSLKPRPPEKQYLTTYNKTFIRYI